MISFILAIVAAVATLYVSRTVRPRKGPEEVDYQ